MAVTPDSFTEGRLRRRLGVAPARREDGSYLLAGANLSRLSLTKAQFALADLTGAILAGCDLTRANFRSADLRGADLTGAKLHQAELSEADLRGADLRGAMLFGAGIAGSRWAGARLDGAELRDVAVWEADWTDVDLTVATIAELAEPLRRCDPARDWVVSAVDWTVRRGGAAELKALRELQRRRPWRVQAELLGAAVRVLAQRQAAVTGASLSRARPGEANPRSLSHAGDAAELAWREVLGQLKSQRRGE